MVSMGMLVMTMLLFHLARIVWNAVQQLKWYLDGTHAQIKRGRQLGNYSISAHIQSIIGRHCVCPEDLPASTTHFISAHHSFVHPDYVLKDNISIYTQNGDEVVFVEVPPEIEEWKMSVKSFHKTAQFVHGIRFITMPLSSLYVLSEELAKMPQPKIVFGYAVPRSGSTLLCNIFESTGCCVSYSEPAIFTEPDLISSKCQSPIEEAECKKILVASVRLMCRPRSHTVKVFFFKVFPGNHKLDMATCVATLRENFSDVHFLYLYRNGGECMNSLIRLRKQLDDTRIFDYIYFLLPSSIQFQLNILEVVTQEEIQEHVELMNELRRTVSHPQYAYIQAVYVWASHIARYKTFHRIHPTLMLATKFRDLVKQPLKAIDAMFGHCDLPRDLVNKAVEAMSRDSQANSPLSRENLRRIKVDDPSSETRAVFDMICRELSVPGIDADIRIE